jgi:hypothetical protein
MNTESINTIKMIRENIDLVQKEMNVPGTTRAEKKLLGNVLIELNNADNIIINETMMKMVNQLNTSNAELINLVASMEKSGAKIAKLSKSIGKISKVIGVLADITAKAISVGIL